MEKRLDIGIDASRSNVSQKTGTEYYSYEIIKNIILNKHHNFRLYSKTPLEYIKQQENVVNKAMPFPKLWSQIRLSFELLFNKPDVLFEPAHTIPLVNTNKTVVTLHDIGFKYYPELYTPLERYYHDWSMRYSVRRATRIIAISKATRDDLVKVYNADTDKITVIYHGYEKEKYFPLRPNEKIPRYISDMKPYIYFIGRIEAKKNVINLIKAFGELKQDIKVKERLVLAGKPGYMYEQIKEEVRKLDPRIQGDIIELGYVEDEKVSNLMRHAKVFAFPSKFEGFGMPLVEAMASGVPIVGSNTTSIPEIAGDSALLTDPDDYKALSRNISKLINDSELYGSLVDKGLNRSKMFSWKDAASKTLRVIEDAVKG